MTDKPRRLSTTDIASANERRDAEIEERERARQRDEPRTAADRPTAVPDRPTGLSETPAPLFADEELTGYRTRWSAIQTGFVDEPRRAVQEADTLVAELMQRLAEAFASERTQLEGRWERSENVSTEDLRLAMRRYRSFFERLLSI